MAALLSPSHHAVQDFLSGSSPAGDFCHGFDQTMSSQLPEGGGGAVHVAVGKSVEKAVALLQWSFNTFQGHEICILHVHRPSPLIPTLCKFHLYPSILVMKLVFDLMFWCILPS